MKPESLVQDFKAGSHVPGRFIFNLRGKSHYLNFK